MDRPAGCRGRRQPHRLGRTLLTTAEAAAAQAGATLLLDTETDSPAEHLYRTAGWTHYGTAPAYAATRAGALKEGSFSCKRLPPAPAE